MISNDEEANEAVRKILGSKKFEDKSKTKRTCELPVRSVPIQRPIPIFAQHQQPPQKILSIPQQQVPSTTPAPPYTMAMNLSTMPSYPTTTTINQPQYQHTLTYTTLEPDNHHPHHVTAPAYSCQYLDYSTYEYSDTEGLEKALGLDFTERAQRSVEFLST